jgi:hypothetical protein
MTQLTKRITSRGAARLALSAAAVTASVTFAATAYAVGSPVSDVAQKMPTFNGGVYASAYLGNTIYVGGSFTSVSWSGKKYARGGLAAMNAQTGALLSWAPDVNDKVLALAADAADGVVYAAGDFTTVNGTSRDSLAGIDATSGALTSFKHSVSGEPRALAVGHGLLYVGGRITQVDGHARADLAAFTLASGALSAAWAPTADDTVYALTSDTSRIYIGGKFHQIDGISGTGKLAAVTPDTGARDASFKPSVSVMVYSVALGPSSVFAAEGGQGGRAVAYSTSGAAQWQLTTDGDIQALAYLGGVVYTGGHYDNACKSASTGTHGFCNDGSVSRVKLAAVDASNGQLTDWNPTANGVHGVFTLAANPTLGTVAAGGEFTTIGGQSRGRFAQFD